MRRFLSLFALIMLAISSALASRTVYVEPTCWTNFGAKLALYVWNNDASKTGWLDFQEVAGDEGILKVTIPDEYTMMIIVRHSGAAANTHTFDDKWNQTDDLAIPGEDNLLYVLQEGENAPSNGINVGSGITVRTYAVATISKVEIQGGFEDDWYENGVNVVMEGEGNVYTGTIDIDEYSGNYEFKLVVNDDTWLGYDELTLEAPEGWISEGEKGANFVLDTDLSYYQTYTFTATWVPNHVISRGWTLKVEGKDRKAFDFNYEAVRMSPEGHSQVEQLHSFTMTLPAQFTYTVRENGGFMLKNDQDAAFSMDGVAEANGNVVTITLNEQVTTPGDYTLYIDEGAITADGNELLPMSFKYSIIDKAKTFRDQITTDPAEGKVDYLEGIRVLFPAYIGGTYGNAKLTNQTTGSTWELSILDVNRTAIVGWNMDKVTEEGEYELLIPDGTIAFYNQGAGFQLGDLVFHYTIGEPPFHEAINVIDKQPEGQLRVYQRSGMTRYEVTDEPGNIQTRKQTGAMNVVFADDNVVYMQFPVSDLNALYDGWVKGTLSDDGKSIVMPLGQYVCYTHSFDMAVQIWMMKPGTTFDEDIQQELATFKVDEDVKEVVYTINDDGSITLQGTDENHILSAVNRAFGSTFHYLDFEWIGYGDYESVYTPDATDITVPPVGLETQTLIATTGFNDGVSWIPYESEAKIGFSGDNVWLQGITDLLPGAWIKGTREGNTLTFPSGQMLGYYNGSELYLLAAEPDKDGNPVIGNAVSFEYDGESAYISYDDIIISTSKDDIRYLAYYMGMTLATEKDRVITLPEDLNLTEYDMTYQEPDDYGRMVSKSYKVKCATVGQQFYLQGVTPFLPESIIVGELDSDGRLTFKSPQYLGDFDDQEESGYKYPLYFQAFNTLSGALLPAVTFQYNATTQVYSTPSAGVAIGFDKTGLLATQYLVNITLTPAESQGVSTVMADNKPSDNHWYTLDGRRLTSAPTHGGLYIKGGKKVMVK